MHFKAFMDWLVADVTIFGLHGQNWMAPVAVGVILCVVYLLATRTPERKRNDT